LSGSRLAAFVSSSRSHDSCHAIPGLMPDSGTDRRSRSAGQPMHSGIAGLQRIASLMPSRSTTIRRARPGSGPLRRAGRRLLRRLPFLPDRWRAGGRASVPGPRLGTPRWGPTVSHPIGLARGVLCIPWRESRLSAPGGFAGESRGGKRRGVIGRRRNGRPVAAESATERGNVLVRIDTGRHAVAIGRSARSPGRRATRRRARRDARGTFF
jgi:hypothetical protein